MADDIKALRRATNGDEICRILARIGENLHDIVLCDQYIGHGLVEVLRDLTGVEPVDIDVCSSALSLITRLVADNHELNRKLCKPMGFLQKLMKLCSPFEDNGKHDKKSHLALHNQAVALIKTLVLSSECAMPEVASIDLIGQLIKLCGIFFDDSRHTSCCHGNLGYPPRATSYFHDLAHGRKLIGNVREMFPEASMKVVEASEVKEIFEKDTNVCVLSVDLYDTRTNQDIVIREELVKENMAWPKFLSPEKEAKIFAKNKGKEEHIWADITVTSVIDGGHFWAQVGGETVDEKLRNISLTLLKEDQAKCTTVPEVGELVCCKTMVGGHKDVYRGKILQVFRTQDEIVLELFAVDYGFKNVVPLNCVTRITALGRQEPFQARLCCLTGIQPPSSDVNVLVNTAAALRNLAYQSNASRLQILDKNGVDALLKLIVLPDKEIRKQVIGAILNLSINFKTRARIGFLGGIKILLDLINNDFKQEIELLCLAIGALRNLMLASPINRGRCADADGFLILTNMYFSSTSNDVKQQCLGALKNLVGNSWYLLTGSGGVDLRGVVDENRVRPFSLSAVTTPSKLPPMQRRPRRPLRPGEVEAQPIEKALPSHVLNTSSNQETGSAQSPDEMTDGDTDGEERLLGASPPSPREARREVSQDIESYYVRGQAMPFNEDDTREFRHCKETKGLSASVIARPACAFLNAGKGGTVYLGVKKTGVVSGVEISRKSRDRLRCGVDELLNEFRPAVRYDKYQVSFVPVAEEGSSQNRRRNIEIIPDVFVVEVSFNKCSGTVYTTSKNKCYFRCGNANSEYSVQDVRKWVIREQETFYNDQINILKRELCASKQKLETDGVHNCF